MKLSARLSRIKPSPTLAVTARAAALRAEGRDILSLSAGEPDFDTPLFVAEAGIAAIRAGHTRYTDVGGTPAIKDAIIAKFRRDNGLTYGREQILVSTGAKQTIYNLAMALLDAGDEVLIPAPYWVSYPDIVLLAEATPVVIAAGADQGYKITPAQLEGAITPRTRLLMLNSPCNPTGAAYSRAELEALGEVLARHPRVVIATDDIYEHVWWGPEPFCSLATACPALYERTVTINGVSKSHAMTGWRIGYVCGDPDLLAAMRKVHQYTIMSAPTTGQAAALAALTAEGDRYVEEMRQEYDRRRRLIVDGFNTLGLDCFEPRGAFYAFPSIAKTGMSSDDFAMRLLDEEEVAMVPGDAFGASGAGFVRASYATAYEKIEEALNRLERFMRRHG